MGAGLSVDAANAETLAALLAAGLAEAEVYTKRGRSRRVQLGRRAGAAGLTVEEGWAVRAGGATGAFFHAGTGRPEAGRAWPQPAGPALRLPEPASLGDWRAPADLEAPLLGESEARALLEAIGRELQGELPGARLLHASLEEGASESRLLSSRGVDVEWKSRGALLRLEAALPGPRPVRAAVDAAERLAQGFAPSALARRLADRLFILQAGSSPERDRGEFLLAPPVAARLLLGLLPLFVERAGPGSVRLPVLPQRGAQLGSPALTIVDDGRLLGGVLAAPVDGEGTPTREMVLVDEGEMRQPLLPWWAAQPPRTRACGCVRRAGFRDLPAVGPSHLFIRPRAEVSVTALLGGVVRGYYLLDVTGSGRFDFDADRFALPVCGFAVQGGRSLAPVAGAWLCGGISALLRGVQAVARDLAFFPLDGVIGSPSLLATGLELRRSSAAPA